MITRLTDPFSTLLDLQRSLRDAQGRDWQGTGSTASRAFPAINVFQQDQDYVVVTEIPGVRKEQLSVETERNQIRLKGAKPTPYGEDVSVHRRERVSGHFDRTITFPSAIDPDGVKAEYRDGILAVFAPRAAEERARSITIE